MKRIPAPVETVLSPLSKIYRSVVRVRNYAYDRGVLPTLQADLPVMSIGNLTAGGTGKTPLTAVLVQEFRNRSKRVGIVSRGYGGTEKGPSRVETDGTRETALRFGDEPSWLAARFPEIPVFVCPDRVAAVNALALHHRVDCVISDDGFQHRRLKRAIDLVVLDATEPTWHYRPLPVGRMREPFTSLGRAQIAIITKANLARAGQLEYLTRKCDEFRVRVFRADSAIAEFSEFKTKAMKASSEFAGKKLFLASGIGRPETFRLLVKEETGGEIVDHMIFRDHQSYKESDFEEMARRAKDLEADVVMMTEKDAIKLTEWKSEIPLYISKLETRMKPKDLEDVYEIAARHLF